MPTLDYEMSAKKSSSSSKKHSKKHEVEEEEIVKSPTIESESKKRKKSSKDKDREIKEEKSSKKSKHDDDGDKKEKKSKKKKSWGSSDDEEGLENGKAVIVEEEPVKNPNALENFKISDLLKNKLKFNGIEALFPIQAMTYNFIVEGHDLVGRARTGQGKTLAFVLPILESLTSNKNRAKGFGRLPSGIVLVPTRELAKQVHTDFEVYGGVAGLVSCCVYGGAPYGPQESALRRGVDIVIGTPGRIKDMIEKGTLNLKSLKFRVLDEADEMLNMGFVDDVETILGKVEDAKQVQTLLFSATMPDWVKKIAARFLKAERKTADLVGDEKMKASTSVKHIVIPCYYTARPKVVPDVIQCYSSGGRVIVFTETKNDASELSQLLPGARALHGDIQQSQREVILAGFRSGKFLVLVATDVAARGLDINDVQLIIQCEPPRDVETYIHRSGRTGRAGNTGICVMLYGKKKQYMINQIERQAGVKFEHVSAPQPADIAKATGNGAVESIMNVSDSVLPIFKKSAEELMNTSKMTPVDIIAKALAKIAGYTDVKKRSLLTSEEGLSTLILRAGKQMYTPSFAFGVLRRFLPEDKVSDVRSMSLTADSMNAVFDVPNDSVNMFLAGQENASGVNIELLHTLPDLQVRNDQQTRGYGGGHSNGGRGYSNGRSRGGGRGGYSSRGRGRQY